MALKSLTPSDGAQESTAGESEADVTTPQTASAHDPARLHNSDTSNSSTPAEAALQNRKTQLNVYVRAAVADHLRRAVLDLGQRHSLGDLVALLVTEHLDEMVERLAAAETSTATRLRGGRKVRQR